MSSDILRALFLLLCYSARLQVKQQEEQAGTRLAQVGQPKNLTASEHGKMSKDSGRAFATLIQNYY